VITILAFLFVLGVLIFVHELGHFWWLCPRRARAALFARWIEAHQVHARRHGYSIGLIPRRLQEAAGETVRPAHRRPDEFLSKSKWVRFQVYWPARDEHRAGDRAATFTLMRGADCRTSQRRRFSGKWRPAARREGRPLPGDQIVASAIATSPLGNNLAVMPQANRELDRGAARGTRIEVKVTPDW
jgi:hypothetical protein